MISFFKIALLAFVGCMVAFSCSESPQPGLLLTATAPEASPKPALDPALQSFLDDYDRYFSDLMQQAGPPGAAVVVVKDSLIVFMRGYGVKMVGTSDSVNAYTVFRIGSLSKGFAGVLTGMLVNEGLLSWNDPVQQYFPEFTLKDKKQAQRLEIRHLLSHTTGLPYHAFDNLIEQGFDRETIFRQYLKTSKLFSREGEMHRYQNAVFSAIEPVLENATGKTYTELLQQYIFHPAGMNSASCDFEAMQMRQNKALPNFITETGWAADTVSCRYYGFTAAGGLNASAADMGQWLKMLLGHRPDIVTPQTLDEVFTPAVKTGMERNILPGWISRDSAYYAMGWRILQKDTDTLVYHAGFVNNFYSEIAFNRREQIGICVLTNGHSALRGACIREFFERWKNLNGSISTSASQADTIIY